jgi:hypothetical protein
MDGMRSFEKGNDCAEIEMLVKVHGEWKSSFGRFRGGFVMSFSEKLFHQELINRCSKFG